MAVPQRKTKYVSLDGGTNITTPILEIPDGDFIYSINVEPNKTRGITSSNGYERIDGNHTNPSNTTLQIYKYELLSGTTPVQGDIVDESGNLYTVCGITDTEIYLVGESVVSNLVAVFTTTDGNFTVADYTEDYRFVQRIPGSKFPPTLLSDLERPFYDYAIEVNRLTIGEVPGIGPIKGVAQNPHNLRLLAVRRNVADTNDVLYESVPGSGWLDISGTTFTDGGYYRFKAITQASTAQRLYIVNGVDDVHYLDNTNTLGTINTTTLLVDERPKYIEAHADRVVLASYNTVLMTARETPDVTLNYFLLSTNNPVTGLSKFVDDSLFVPTTDSLYIQKGDPDPLSTNFGTWKEHSTHNGAIENTIDASDYPYFINLYGVNNLTDTDKSGQFVLSSISDKVLPIINNRYDKEGLPVSYVGAFIDREKDLYRVYRSDGIIMNMLKNEERFFPITFSDYNTFLNCTGEFKDYDGEYMIAGAGLDGEGNSTGFVYKMESGHSLDGEEIVHSLKTPYAHLNSPAVKKRFFKFTTNSVAPEKVTLTYKADFNTGSSRFSDQLELDTISGQSRFNQGFFNASTFSSNFVDEVGGYINGSGTNMSLNMNITTKNTEGFTLQGIIYHYALRGLKR